MAWIVAIFIIIVTIISNYRRSLILIMSHAGDPDYDYILVAPEEFVGT